MHNSAQFREPVLCSDDDSHSICTGLLARFEANTSPTKGEQSIPSLRVQRARPAETLALVCYAQQGAKGQANLLLTKNHSPRALVDWLRSFLRKSSVPMKKGGECSPPPWRSLRNVFYLKQIFIFSGATKSRKKLSAECKFIKKALKQISASCLLGSAVGNSYFALWKSSAFSKMESLLNTCIFSAKWIHLLPLSAYVWAPISHFNSILTTEYLFFSIIFAFGRHGCSLMRGQWSQLLLLCMCGPSPPRSRGSKWDACGLSQNCTAWLLSWKIGEAGGCSVASGGSGWMGWLLASSPCQSHCTY